MNPTELLVRHSFAPNRLHYCGANDLSLLIPEFISAPSLALQQKLQNELKSFKGLMVYLELIARENHRGIFDDGVGEAYWIGNPLLDKIFPTAVENLFDIILARDDYLGPELAAEARARLTPDFVMHHSFHVFFTHFITDAVPATIDNLNRCRIAPARVEIVQSDSLMAEYRPIREHDRRLFFTEPEKIEIAKPFDDEIRPGDWVSMHWNMYCMKLSREQKENLERYTKLNIDTLNSLVQN